MSHPYGTFDDKMPHHGKCHQMLSKGVMGMFGTDWAIRKYNHVDGSINYVKILFSTFLTGNCEFQVFWVHEFFRLEVYLGLSSGAPLRLHGNCVI